MSLIITSRIREELELDIPTSFFVDYPSISDAKMAISALLGTNSSGGAMPSSSTENPTPGEPDTTSSIPKPNDQCLTNSIVQSRVNSKALPFATSILLSGTPKTASKTIPYGSGSATSYAKLPSISKDVCFYALNSPFMKIPGDFTNGIVAQYLAEIKRRSPKVHTF